MVSPQQQQQQQSFKPTEILYLEVRKHSDGQVFYHEMLQSPYQSEVGFREQIKKIIKNNGHPEQTRRPTFEQDNSANPRDLDERSIRCSGCDTEVIIYIPIGTAAFDPKRPPFKECHPKNIVNQRLFYVGKSDNLEVISNFSDTNDESKCQLAVFSYKGSLAAVDRGSKTYFSEFTIDPAVMPIYPGSGDIGHPGGNHT